LRTCALSAGEAKILAALPVTARRDHAWSLRKEACARDILKASR
jgi:hypothetical protein